MILVSPHNYPLKGKPFGGPSVKAEGRKHEDRRQETENKISPDFKRISVVLCDRLGRFTGSRRYTFDELANPIYYLDS